MSTRLKNYEKKRVRNKHYMSLMKTERKKCLAAIIGKKDNVGTQLGKMDSVLQKLKSKGILHRKTSARLMSRIAKKITT